MKTKLISALLISALTTGCATQGMGANYSPIIDRPNSSSAQDLIECQQHATKVASAAESAAAGAVMGAIFGAVLMAAAGGKGYRNEAAGVGAIQGIAAGAASGETNQREIIRKCMAGRGHTVLN